MAQQESTDNKPGAFEFTLFHSHADQNRFRLQYDGTINSVSTPGLAAARVNLSPEGECLSVNLFEMRSFVDPKTSSNTEVKDRAELKLEEGTWKRVNPGDKGPMLVFGEKSPTGLMLQRIVAATQVYHATWRETDMKKRFRSWKSAQVAYELVADSVEKTSQIDTLIDHNAIPYIDPAAIPNGEEYFESVV
jgi:hypothetical protein